MPGPLWQPRKEDCCREMVVLVSDGNSQDHWDRLLDASNKLRELDVDLYAVTVSHDYFFRFFFLPAFPECAESWSCTRAPSGSCTSTPASGSFSTTWRPPSRAATSPQPLSARPPLRFHLRFLSKQSALGGPSPAGDDYEGLDAPARLSHSRHSLLAVCGL